MFEKNKIIFLMNLFFINFLFCTFGNCSLIDSNNSIVTMDFSSDNIYFVKLENYNNEKKPYNVLFKIDNDGSNLEKINLKGIQIDKPNIISVKVKNDLIMIITFFDTIDYGCTNLFISKNNGHNWINIPFFKENKIYILDALLEDSVFLLSTDKGIYKSTDEGIRWECDTLLPIRLYKTIVNDGDKKYYISDSIIYYINQNKEMKSILPKQIVMGGNLIFFNNEIYQADLKGVYYSNDFGNTWENITYNMPLPNYTQQIQIFKFRNSIYTLKKEGLYYYLSKQKYWIKLPLLKENKFFFSNTAVIFNDKLFLSSTRYGILKSDDGINFDYFFKQ